MKVTGLGTVFLRVSNLENSIEFYSKILQLELQGIEQWEVGRGASYIISPNSPLLTLIESNDFQSLHVPSFNLNCSHILEIYDELKTKGINVGSVNRWSSERNDHIDFDIFDPDGNSINLIECKSRANT